MREIEAFLAVADELHFGRAAQRLHVTTARVSQAIRTLEGQAGAPLFERTSRRVALTPLGDRLLAGFRPGYARIRDGLHTQMREVEAFLAVADELHFGRAARLLGISTSSVSEAVRMLERRVGAPLFERTSRQVTLTPVGKRLLTQFRPGYDQLRQSLQEVQRAARRGGRDVLRAGFSTTAPRDLVGRVIKVFEQLAPGCQVARIDLPGSEVFRWFEKGQFETEVFVGWMPDPDAAPRPVPGWVEIGPVACRWPRCALMGASHPLAGRGTLDIEELADHEVLRPHVYAPYADAWAPAVTPGGRPMRLVPQERTWYIEDVITRLEETGIIHFTPYPLPGAWADHGLVGVPVTGLPPLACAVLWAKRDQSPWIPAFAEGVACGYDDA